MAKLPTPTTAGFNADKKEGVKYIQIDKIKIDPEIAGIFDISEKVVKEIQAKIEKLGYNEEEPVVIWKGENILVDGRTRLSASMNAGLEKIPVFEKEFEDREAAILYTFERQVMRRNLTGAEILTAVQMIKGRKEHDGTGRAAEILAEKIGTSPNTVYKAKAINKEGTPEDKMAIKNGKKSIKKVYKEIKDRQRPEKEFPVNDSTSLPGNIAFLESAVILLIDKGEKPAVELLMNHFLRKNEKVGFYKLLPKKISEQLLCCSGSSI